MNGVYRVDLSIVGLAKVLLWVCVYGGVRFTSVFVEDLQCSEGANVGLGVFLSNNVWSVSELVICNGV